MVSAQNPTNIKILLTLLGLVVGVVITALFFTLFVSNQEKDKSGQNKILSLSLNQQEKFVATSEKRFTISGKTSVASIITINSGTKNIVLSSDDGDFSSEIELVEGNNTIEVTAFDPQKGSSQTQRREVLYLMEELNNL